MTTFGLLIALTVIPSAILIGLLGVPLAQGRVAPNRRYGARFAKSFESDELWYRINAHAGRGMIRWSLSIAALALICLFAPPNAQLVALVVLPSLFLVPCWNTYRYSRSL